MKHNKHKLKEIAQLEVMYAIEKNMSDFRNHTLHHIVEIMDYNIPFIERYNIIRVELKLAGYLHND